MKGYSWSREDYIELLYSKYFPMDEITNGCLGIGEQQTDYLLCEGDIDTLPELYKQDTKRYQYNQSKRSWSVVSCTIFAAAGMLSDLKNYEFSEAQLKEMDELSYSMGRIRGQGWYVQSAVKCVADRWNNSELSEKLGKVAYYRISKYDTATIKGALDKLYTLDTNYNGNQNYNKDYKADGVLNGTDFGTATYGHSIGIIDENGQMSVKDNYYGRQYNIYSLANEIGKIKCYGSYLYIYVNADNLNEIKRLNELKSKVVQVTELNSQIWHLVNDENYKNSLHKMNNDNRKKLDDVETELKKYY